MGPIRFHRRHRTSAKTRRQLFWLGIALLAAAASVLVLVTSIILFAPKPF